MNQLLKRLVSLTHALLTCQDFVERHKRLPKDFTRKRKIGFDMIMRFLLNMVHKSLQTEVDEFYDAIGQPLDQRATMDAFIKAREKVKPSAYVELFDMTADAIISSGELPTTNGYTVFAIDGTELAVQATEDVLKHIGYSPNAPTRAAARVSILCEVRSGAIIDAVIGPLKEGERSMAMKHLERLFAYERAKSKSVVLFDRGYPSKELLAHFFEKNAFFLMRVQRSFNARIDGMDYGETVIEIPYGEGILSLRACKFRLPSGVDETLITNLPVSDFSTDELFTLYAQRWGVETQYDTVKNRLQLERFSGRKWDYILQDFYAVMYLSNIVAVSACAANEILDKQARGKNHKHPHAVSKNVLIGKLKNKLILALAAPTALGRSRRMNHILKQAAKSYDNVRPNRQPPPRSRRETHHKTSLPRKSAL